MDSFRVFATWLRGALDLIGCTGWPGHFRIPHQLLELLSWQICRPLSLRAIPPPSQCRTPASQTRSGRGSTRTHTPSWASSTPVPVTGRCHMSSPSPCGDFLKDPEARFVCVCAAGLPGRISACGKMRRFMSSARQPHNSYHCVHSSLHVNIPPRTHPTPTSRAHTCTCVHALVHRHCVKHGTDTDVSDGGGPPNINLPDACARVIDRCVLSRNGDQFRLL